MRPDEHKKKKNAAYKKKHGIGQTKAGQSDDKVKQKRGEQNKDSSQLPRKESGRDVRESVPKKDKAQALASSSDSEGDEVRQPKKTFQRRKIESNWQKYELEPDNDEKQEARGESFEKLLSMSGDAVAHFRFKDEQEWDVVGAFADSTIKDDLYMQYLRIDAQQIGQAMDCLPLYKVLGLNPELFPNGEVELMETTAAKNRQSHMPQQSTSSTAISLFSQYDTTNDADQKYLMKDASKPSADSSADDHLSWNHAGPDLSTQSSDSSELSPTGIVKIPPPAESTPSASRLVLQDEDLDSLLDLDTPQATCTDTVSRLNHHSSQQPNSSDQSNTTTVSKGSNSVPTTLSHGEYSSSGSQESKEKPQKDGVDLEDWLNSILDD